MKNEKIARLEQVNELIKVISSYGRRFFYDEASGRIAYMTMGKGGHLYFVDDYSLKLIYVAYSGRWSGFSHGGTLRNLIEAFSHYIRSGECLPLGLIGPQRMDNQSNIWGYSNAEMEKCRQEALKTGVVALRQEDACADA